MGTLFSQVELVPSLLSTVFEGINLFSFLRIRYINKYDALFIYLLSSISHYPVHQMKSLEVINYPEYEIKKLIRNSDLFSSNVLCIN